MWAKSAMEVSSVADGRWRIEDGARHKGENLTAKNARTPRRIFYVNLCDLCG
jgi:hypothetical protein